MHVHSGSRLHCSSDDPFSKAMGMPKIDLEPVELQRMWHVCRILSLNNQPPCCMAGGRKLTHVSMDLLRNIFTAHGTTKTSTTYQLVL